MQRVTSDFTMLCLAIMLSWHLHRIVSFPCISRCITARRRASMAWPSILCARCNTERTDQPGLFMHIHLLTQLLSVWVTCQRSCGLYAASFIGSVNRVWCNCWGVVVTLLCDTAVHCWGLTVTLLLARNQGGKLMRFPLPIKPSLLGPNQTIEMVAPVPACLPT